LGLSRANRFLVLIGLSVSPRQIGSLLDLRYFIIMNRRIIADPDIMLGKPCIAGTRVTVELILRKLAAGRSFADVIEAYPNITEHDIRAALDYAADRLRKETMDAAE
jgi:uncharacterized protein (DUF433 family)